MNEKKAKLKFNPNNFEVIEQGEYVVCAVSGKHIDLNKLTYWNSEFQEAYFSPKEAQKRYEELKNNSGDTLSREQEKQLTSLKRGMTKITWEDIKIIQIENNSNN